MRNSNLDLDMLAKQFAVTKRLQIRDIFTLDAATAIQSTLANDVPWEYVFRRAGKEVSLSARDIQTLQPAERATISQQILAEAKEGFQFAFFKYSMVEAYRNGKDPDLFLHRVLETIAAGPFLEFAKRVTGDPRIARVDAQATLYDPGNFLTLHDDESFDGQTRLYAYVLNFSKDWRADWGGQLQFHDQDGNIIDCFLPRFNSMSLFRVPTLHSVSMVTPFAHGPRLAITGWFTH